MSPEAPQPSLGRLFIAYADTPWRRRMLASSQPLPDEYILFGLSELRRRGWAVAHNLELPPPGRIHSTVTVVLNWLCARVGLPGGDWSTPLRFWREMNASEVVLCTVDRTGIPTALLGLAGLVRRPIVYVSVGLPERLQRSSGGFASRLIRRALRRTTCILCYGWEEAAQLRAVLDLGDSRVTLVPFGVDTDRFRPRPDASPEVDVLTVGADPHRDFSLLVEFAKSHPSVSVRCITTSAHAAAMLPPPANMEVRTDVPLVAVRDEIARARVIALPVRENSYSGGTTVLLQAMAMGKPVVVSCTGAILGGYHLADGLNCRLVAPGSAEHFSAAIRETLDDPTRALEMGRLARQTVERHLSWEHYVDSLSDHLHGAATHSRSKEPRPPR